MGRNLEKRMAYCLRGFGCFNGCFSAVLIFIIFHSHVYRNSRVANRTGPAGVLGDRGSCFGLQAH